VLIKMRKMNDDENNTGPALRGETL
jgi:hypothetical protein